MKQLFSKEYIRKRKNAQGWYAELSLKINIDISMRKTAVLILDLCISVQPFAQATKAPPNR
jgi:hypothetical protein